MSEPSDHSNRAAADSLWIKRIASAATRYREAILAPRVPTLEIYAFGKHPAWRDFIDPSLLPATPRPFLDFHLRLRSTAEAELAPKGRSPLLAAWRNPDSAAVLFIIPSRDGADPFTGSTRSSPLFLGCCIRGSLGELFRFSVPRLTSLGAYLLEEGRTAGQFVAGLRGAARSWTKDFDALCNGKPRPEPERQASFQAAIDRVWAYEAAAPQACFLVLSQSSFEIMFAVAMGVDSIDAHQFRTALARVV